MGKDLKVSFISVKLIEGDRVALLAEIVEKIPKEFAICIFHTHVAKQMSESVKNGLIE